MTTRTLAQESVITSDISGEARSAQRPRLAGLPSGLRVLGAIATMVDEAAASIAGPVAPAPAAASFIPFPVPSHAELAATLQTVSTCAPAPIECEAVVVAQPQVILPSSLFQERPLIEETEPAPVAVPIQSLSQPVVFEVSPAEEPCEVIVEASDEMRVAAQHTAIVVEETESQRGEATAEDGPKMHVPSVDRDEFPALLEKLTAAIRYGRTRVIHWHAAGDGVQGRRQLEALAETWGATRSESLLFVDAQPDPTTVSSRSGWWDVIAGRAALSAALRDTDHHALARMDVGRFSTLDADARLRLAGGLLALQRDHRAIWLVTSGAWSPAAQALAEAAHERYLIVPTREPAAWRTLSGELVARNVLINGWIALAPRSGTESLRMSA